MTRSLTPLTLALAAAILGTAAMADAKPCKRLCRPVVRRICADKYPGNARIQRLCRHEGNVEILPYCRAEPNRKRCI